MSNCYCARLRAAARRIGSVYDEALEPDGINVAQYSLMSVIQRRQPVSLTELGRAAELERSTIGRNVRVLERAELVEVGRGDGDHREAAVSLSRRGAEVLVSARSRWDACQQAIEARLGADKVSAFDDLLNSI
ncbi:MarR family transcriptional regulator (plasmid) [Sphingomonas panacis]|uniref:MarR family transcriptional regulator n=2 Tax=Sphingomonas panacis TaxID=1560345 RepID=A0A1B3ZIC5_9SPHN|nr:MarR family transcriptional regulator [Sphingomonas panacis]